MLFLTAIYEEMSLSYSVLGLTEKECRAVMNEKIAAAALLWDEENYDEEGEFLTRSNMASVCLKHFQEWGWLKQDYDEALNSYVVTFPEYSQMYVELFRSLLDEQESEERESVMTIYSHLYTYSSDKEKNNEILKSALRVSKKLVQMLVNMQDGMRGYFDELSRQKDFRGIQDVLVKEINNSDSRKYAILTTTDSFYRYKEAVKELLDRNLQENDMSRLKLLRELEEVRQKKMKDEENAGKVKDPKKTDEAEKIKELRLERAAAMCEEAADTLIRIERQFDAIERRYNKLIEQKTIFASRAAARIRYVLQEGAEEDRTVALVDLLNKSRRKEEISEKLAERIRLSRPHRALTDESLYKRKEKGREAFVPATVSEGGQAELKNGTLAAELQAKTKELTSRIEEKEQAAGRLREKEIETGKKKGKLEEKIKALKERLDFLMKGYVPNDEIFAEVRSALETKSEAAYKKEMTVMAERLFEKETKLQDERIKSRNAFNNTYPAYGFSGVEHDNEVYDKVLERCRKDFEPKYKEEFEKQYELVYHSLRDNVIATIHGEIKSAYRHRRQINKMLSQIRFSDSIYQIDISPAKNENGQFYEMLMAEELDSKVIDHSGFDGQMSLMEDEFFRKYERKIGLLTEKFMPSREEDGAGREKHKNEMERFADYRNYLDFNMYEQSIDENGIEKKNYVDDMAGVDSGGEGQNPKYVALLAGFAMLYMQQSNRDSKIRLVLLDEAFSKMDKERSEVCLKYARELELQLIVCVPDERLQSLIRNVDSVYGFRRFRNQVTMMHIDKGN